MKKNKQKKNKISKDAIPTKYPLVHVQWADAHSTGNSWRNKEDIVRDYHSTDWIIHSIGFLIEKNRNYIILAAQYDTPDSLYGKTIKIPRTWCKIKKLTYK